MDIQAIIKLRLKIKDPSGYPKIAVVDEFPSKPDELTIYRVGEDEYYNSDKERLSLHLSDETLEEMIGKYGKYAECRCYNEIAKNLGHEMRISRLTTGAESTEWQSLADLYRFYKDLSDECSRRLAEEEGGGTGLMGRSRQPKITGGWPL